MSVRVRRTARSGRLRGVFALAIIIAGMTSAPATLAVDCSKTTCPIVQGAGSTWSQIAVDQWRADVSPLRPADQLPGRRSSTGRRKFYAARSGPGRLRGLGDPVRRPGARRAAIEGQGRVRIPADRRRRDVVHVQPQRRRRAADHDPAAVVARRWPGSSPATIKKWNDPPSVCENPGLDLAGPADHARRPIRRIGDDGAVHRVHGEVRARQVVRVREANSIAARTRPNYPSVLGSVRRSPDRTASRTTSTASRRDRARSPTSRPGTRSSADVRSRS